MGLLRLQKDLAQYKKQEISFVKLSFPDENSLQFIHVQIFPQLNSIYRNCGVIFSLQFPDSYPMDPPKLKCLNKIYHPNISYVGNVCLPLVRQDFSPTVNLTSIICGLIYILTYPNDQDALIPQIGDLMKKDFNLFQKIVFHTIEGRPFNNKQYDRIICYDLIDNKKQKAKQNLMNNFKNIDTKKCPQTVQQKTQLSQPNQIQKLQKKISSIN